ncbi:hypothetical protein SLEP1_g42422 [Rubroshorea leprosula]|uniref:Transmembrane protein n=1 Tax=Rubroshorea leprosula TaxID=152421 RepID=A0AAV5L9Q8_9ROSI|nr:hypothetical protein SLEP1_g42422 [Rubroshorea leprosula]
MFVPSFLAQEPSFKLRTLSPKPRIFQICTVSSPCCPSASAMCDCWAYFREFPCRFPPASPSLQLRFLQLKILLVFWPIFLEVAVLFTAGALFTGTVHGFLIVLSVSTEIESSVLCE